MSDTVAPVKEHERDEAGPPPPPPPPPTYQLLHRVRWIGYVLLGVQLVGFLAWSDFLYSHFSDTSDFSLYNQAWFLAAHGNLNPLSTLAFSTDPRLHYWQNDAEFLPLILGPFYWVFRSGVGLPWLQDISIVGAEAIAFTWICDMARSRCREREAALLAVFGLLLLIANPWTWWAVSFDVHTETLAVGFVALLLWDLTNGRRRAWIWVPLVLLASAPCASYVIGAGLGGVLTSRRLRCPGTAMALVGVAYILLIVLIHGDVAASLPNTYGYLATPNGHVAPGVTLTGLVAGIATHPLNILRAVWDKRVDVVANFAPSGLIGIGAPILIPLLLVVLLANTLVSGVGFTEPLFQSVPIYVFLPIGTVAFIMWLLPRHRRASFILVGLIAAQALGWAVVWGPQTPGEWLRISDSQVGTLARIKARIPESAEVVASQGVLGPFSSRTRAYNLFAEGEIPVGFDTWFVIVPNAGIETLSPATTMALIGELAGPYHATLVAHANGVWAFHWNPPSSVRDIEIPGNSSPLPAWAAAGTAGRAVLEGPVSDWHMQATGAVGYVSDGMEWQKAPGSYLASVTLAATGTVNVEVWNDTSNTLLARQTVMPTGGRQTIVLPVNATIPYQASVDSGWGPFRADFVSPPAGERLEVRVWSPGKTFVNVYSADMTAASGGAGGL